MNTKTFTSSASNAMAARFRRRIGRAPTELLVVLALTFAAPSRAETSPAAIPFSDIGARATAGYQGDALGVAATADGARLHCGFQKLEGHATPEGLWLESTTPGAAGRLRLSATALCRDRSRARECALTEPDVLELIAPTDVGGYTALETSGTVSVSDNLVRFTRAGLTEEYSVSVDGVRQDFIIVSPPLNLPPSTLNSQPSTLNHSAGDLRLELMLSGARAEAAAYGARHAFEGSGRILAYSRLRAEDATGRELAAHLEVLAADRVALSVADANAVYPVRIDPTFTDANWVSLNPSLPGANSYVNAVAVDGSGNVYVGGEFTFIGSTMANGVAKWDGSAWSALGSGMDSEVDALAVSGTNLYAGGRFAMAGGVRVNAVAKWDGTAWSALGSGVGGSDLYVYALAASGTNLYAGGGFTHAGGVTANHVAKWDGRTWSALGSGMNSSVYALAVSGTSLYAGGSFTVPGLGVARWDGTSWSALGSGLHGQVNALAVSGTSLFAGGEFYIYVDSPANRIAKWDGKSWSAVGSGLLDTVYALAVVGTDLYAGGQFSGYLAKWNGSTWSFLASGLTGYPLVYALAASGTNLFVGGTFSLAGASDIARWNGSAWSALTSGLGGGRYSPYVYSLAVSGTNLYAGGSFTIAGALAADGIAKWDGNAWSPLSSGVGGAFPCVYALAVSAGDLYAGGSFASPGGCIARWDGGTWSPLGSGIGGSYPNVYAVAVMGTDLYVGGGFSTAGGMPITNVAKWNGSAWSALGGGLNAYVAALAVTGSNLYAGGGFTKAGAVQANHIAKWDGSTWSALGSGMNDVVAALAVNGTDLYAGGYFTNAGGVRATYVAKWDGTAWSALGSGLGGGYAYYPYVAALAVDKAGNLFAGGNFTTAGGRQALRFAVWDGTTWSAMGGGVSGSFSRNGYDNPYVYALATDSVGRVFAGGGFLVAGPMVSPYIVQGNVCSAPNISYSPPRTQTAEAGTVLDISPTVTGEPSPVYQWYYNGTYLPGFTGPDLRLTNVQFSDSGTYVVVITNAFGAITGVPITLNVIAAVEHRPSAGLMLSGETGTVLNVDYVGSPTGVLNWLPLGAVRLTSASQGCFDVTEPLPPQRYYRVWQTGTPALVPSVEMLGLIPAITLTGRIGSSVRLDYIDRYGPTGAWVTLDAVTLTNTSQFYFDISALRHPERLYRLVPMP